MIKINPLDKDIREITVKRPNGEIHSFITLGATWTRWQREDGVEMLARYDDVTDYKAPGLYLGNTIGPLAGRVENSRFKHNEKEYVLASKGHLLHGGDNGFSFANFDIDIIQNQPQETIVSFKLLYSKKNYPGKLSLNVNYHLYDNEVRIVFKATTTMATFLNITNHAYFNLDGDFSQAIDSHELLMFADKVVIPDEAMIGREIVDVKGTALDFTTRKNIVAACNDKTLKTASARGIDHYFILKEKRPYALELSSNKANKRLIIETSYPGVVLYATNDTRDKVIQTGKIIPVHGALAIEPQFMSNAVNDQRFPTCELKKNKVYEHYIHYKLGDVK